MSALRRLASRLHGVMFARRLDEATDEELRAHLDMLADDYARSGMSPEEARRQARLRLGGVEQTKELVRDARATWVDAICQDARYALRTFRRDPGFTAVAVLTLAVGIGASTGIFSLVYATIFRPLPYPDSRRLITIGTVGVNDASGDASYVSPAQLLEWQNRAKSFDLLGGAWHTGMVATGIGQPLNVDIAAASADFLRLLGVRPLAGRLFTAEEDRPGRNDVALVDARFWQRELGADRNVAGRVIVLGGKARTIVGVLPSGFAFGFLRDADVWIPLAADPDERGLHAVQVVGRLRPGVTLERAQAEMDAIGAPLERDAREGKRVPRVRSLQDSIVGSFRAPFLALLAAVVFVLLIGCANVANLLLARATARQKEMAIRASLGAGRLRLARQMLVESTLLAAAGGAVAVAIAVASVRAVPLIRGYRIPRVEEIAVDWRLFAVAALVTIGSGILCGLAPALQVRGRSLLAALQQHDAPGGARPRGPRLRHALVAAQLALALVLLTGAGLMANTLLRLLRVDLGFDRAHVVAVSVRPSHGGDRGRAFFRQLQADIGRMPGVERVSASDQMPLMRVKLGLPLEVEGDPGHRCEAFARVIGPGYFGAMHIPLVAGRDVREGDEALRPTPIFVNQKTARALFGDANPVGRRVLSSSLRARQLEVAGVARDVRQMGLRDEAGSQLYLPLGAGFYQYVIARVSSNAGDLTAAIREAVRRLDPEAPAPVLVSMDDRFATEIATPRFYLGLLGIFAVVAVLLAAGGLYGVLSYTIARRTHEFGIRMALGAGRARIVGLLFAFGLRLAAIGVVVGVAGALALTRLLASLLYEVRPGDPWTLAATSALLVSLVLLCCGGAARRATRIDPMSALRCE